MGKWKILLLAGIVLLAFFLRFYKVTEIPPSLNWDEVSIGYNAYSILKTGRDEWGVFLPIHFKAYGEFKLPVQIYASIPGIAIFGLNELGVRITPVIYGTLTVLFLFFLTRALFKKDEIGFMAAFFLGVSPWHIQLTRASFESSFAAFWIVLGLWFLVKGFDKHKWIIFSIIPLAVSIYTYNSARIFTPFFLLAIVFIYRQTFLKFRKEIIISILIFIAAMLPLVPSLFSGERTARFKLVSVTDDPGLIPRINESRGKSSLPWPLPRLIHNKVTYVSFYVTQNYLAHFNPDFLFISGAPHKQHHVQGVGELYWVQAPFLFLGLYFLFKKRHPFKWLVILGILIAFIPVSITNDSIPHALRTLIAVPFYAILTGFGIYETYLFLKNKKKLINAVLLVVFILFVINFVIYLNNLFNLYSKNYSRDWQYGYEQAVEYIEEHSGEYDEIVFSRTYGEPHMFTLFFLNYDPVKYQTNPNLIRYESFDWVWVLKFDKFYFPDLGDKGTTFTDIVARNPDKKLLFIGKPGDFPKEWQRLNKISFLNNNPAFDIVEKK
ncbi:MAG: hypothetical protein US31_C0004G0039 [Berkelbacteria bacterium GW2011_GWA1_36_9]|uniref:Glycosyltransferase RgtA/B/C/D-like domain-containing protein n=1 Tax=Berkelbacteria bacterium GW2011_GWA1_36_9 TaxID=1618331 RepID=A0A0G0FKW3_9BACT|nr:MAG: hypothetical protein US31_C0004G0039 [Berkelbacteria bacterium GW2011_GWA1_36_9]